MKPLAVVGVIVLGLLAGVLFFASGLFDSMFGGEEPPAPNGPSIGALVDDPPAPAGLNAPAAGSPESLPDPVPPSPAQAPPPPAGAGAKAIDAWHRALPAVRPAVAAAQKGRMSAELQAFAGIWSGDGAAYAAAVKLEPPRELGQDFAGLAAAFASGDSAGLEAALSAATERAPAWMAWQEALAARALGNGEYARAGRALGQLIPAMLAAGYARESVLAMQPQVSQAARFASSYLPSQVYQVQSGDSLDPIARRQRQAGVQVAYGWIADFNGKRKADGTRHYNITVGEKLKIPTTPLRVQVWRQARLAVVWAGEVPVRLFDVSVGQPGHETPVGQFEIGLHEKEPIYYRQGGTPLPFGHPENPLGTRWLGFVDPKDIGFHGTSNELTIGSFETLGCIRLRNRDVEDLYELVPDKTAVLIQP